MMTLVSLTLVCSLLYVLKGGLFSRPLFWLQSKVPFLKFPFFDFVLDGTQLSAFGFCVLTGSPLGMLGWWIGVIPSLGEIVGRIGGYRGNWHRSAVTGQVIEFSAKERPAARATGFKMGLQRGVFMGAALALFMWSPVLIIPGVVFPAVVWLGVSIAQWKAQQVIVSWFNYEILFGAIIGIALYFHYQN